MNIVIPTLMISPVEGLYYTLDTLTKSFLTTGIIIIDNSQYGLFSKWSRLTGVRFHQHPKVRVIENYSNKYVNPSWNQGLAECFGDNTIVMNDDVFVCGEVIEQVSRVMDDNALCSVDTVQAFSQEEYVEQYNAKGYGTLSVSDRFPQKNNNKCGWFFCINNDIWKDIPEELKYFYGDDLIFDRARALGYTPKCITSCSIGHMGSQTVNKKPDIQEILKQEFKTYNRVKQEYIKL